jgi:hypothetical protein
MSYGPYRIQPEGREIQIGAQEQFVTRECEEGSGSEESQGYRTATHICQGCGAAFRNSRPAGRIVRFCSKQCRYKEAPYWVPCSKCHAALGLGCKKSRQLLGKKEYSSISIYWKKHGIVPALPKSGSWRKELVSKGINYVSREKKTDPKSGWWGDEMDAYAWMTEYYREMPDWSYFWTIHRQRITSKAYYHGLSDKEKAERNKRNSSRKKYDQAKYLRDWKTEKRKSDPAWNVAQVMRSRLSSIMKSNGALSRSVTQMEQYIGCSLSELRNHLESRFTKKMNWKNYGTYWHVDHILPVSKFNHLDPNQVAQCWHFTNLAPLSATANIRKGARILNPQMSLML